MIIPKEMIDRRVSILMEGLPVADIKVLSSNATELLGSYDDGEEVHIDPTFIRAWWASSRKATDPEKAKERARKMIETKKKRGLIRS
jgi:hypothetical protein